MAKLMEIMGKFPFEPDKKKPVLIRKQDYSMALYPPNNAFTSDNTYTIVTTDTFMLGIYELGPGGAFDPLDIHTSLAYLGRTPHKLIIKTKKKKIKINMSLKESWFNRKKPVTLEVLYMELLGEYSKSS